MMVKAVLLVCAQALMIQSIAGQCLGSHLAASPFAAPFAAASPFAAAPWAAVDPWTASAPWGASAPWAGAAAPWAAGGPLANPFATGVYGPTAAAASNGGALSTSSASAFPPNGVSLISDNAYEGALAVSGALPFLGTVALEGALPTAGAGAVAYGCGNGEVAMLSEDVGAAGAYTTDAFGYRAAATGYGMGALAYDAAFAGPARAGWGCGARF